MHYTEEPYFCTKQFVGTSILLLMFTILKKTIDKYDFVLPELQYYV